MPTAVLFDLDCTLTDRPATVRRFAAEFVKFNDRLLADAAAVAAAITAADGNGYAPRPAVCDAVGRLAWRGAPPSAAELLSFWRDRFPAATAARAGASDVLADLRAAGVRTAVVSNGAGDTQRRKLAAAGLAGVADAVVVSGEVGCRKPDPAIFRLALDRLGATAADAWFVGDHPVLDMDGARRAGLTTVWMADVHPWPGDVPRPSHALLGLADLMPLVRAAAKG